MHWFIDPIKNHYFDFEGRVGRQAFWMYILIYTIIYVVLAVVMPALAALFALAVLCPGLGITARRLHDIEMSGWWQLIGLIPILGLIIMIVLLVRDSQPGDNKYGPHPGHAAAAPVDATSVNEEPAAAPESETVSAESEEQQPPQQNQGM